MSDTTAAPVMTGDLDDPNVRAVLAYQQAMARGDLDAARTVFHPEVEYVVPGRNPLAGRYRGPDAVMGYLGRLMALTDGSYAITRMHWMTSGDHVALLSRNAATRQGRRAEWDEVIVFAFEDGRKRRIDLLSGDQYAVDELLG